MVHCVTREHMAGQVCPLPGPAVSEGLKASTANLQLSSRRASRNERMHVAADNQLATRLQDLGAGDAAFWEFRGNARRDLSHRYFQYPAMMVPQLQSLLVETVLRTVPGIESVIDPFVGSGTMLTEAMRFGLSFTGLDVNPLAVLICRAKCGPLYVDAVERRADRLFTRIEGDRSTRVDVDFAGLSKWFAPPVARSLSRIRRAIINDDRLWSRRFFWVAFATAVRLSSNSRTSTFKLHIRSREDLRHRSVDPRAVFSEEVSRNLEALTSQRRALAAEGLLSRGRYTRDTRVELMDARQAGPHSRLWQAHDLLVTSPPYGDNLTTVPYGQHAYLPLQWIDLKDIDPAVDRSCLSTTKMIDRESLGGRHAGIGDWVPRLVAQSQSFCELERLLRTQPRDRLARVAAFCRDLDQCLDPILGALRPGAYMVWTVGNRRVGGQEVPLDRILQELLERREASTVARLDRPIPHKRMAVRNNVTATIRSETILVLRKAT